MQRGTSQNRPVLRRMQSAQSESDSLDESRSQRAEEDVLNPHDENSGDCYALQVTTIQATPNRPATDDAKKKITFRATRKCHLYSPSMSENAVASAWTNYIQGSGRKPRRNRYQETLISTNHSESARNKPLIWGRCAGEKAKLFLDSGAEMNVIDCDFLNSLLLKQFPVTFKPGASKIQCANGTKMDVTGFASMTLQIGSVKAVQKFMVVNRLFPRIIVGIRTMKMMNIVMDPTSDCVYVDGNSRVPFVSCTVPPSTAASTAGKV